MYQSSTLVINEFYRSSYNGVTSLSDSIMFYVFLYRRWLYAVDGKPFPANGNSNQRVFLVSVGFKSESSNNMVWNITTNLGPWFLTDYFKPHSIKWMCNVTCPLSYLSLLPIVEEHRPLNNVLHLTLSWKILSGCS